ncbi:DMT family transporter [Luteimonas sp. RIT-PG2_3]
MRASPPASRALAWMLMGAALIGTNGLMVQMAGTPPTVSAFWRMIFAGGMLLAYVLLVQGWQRLRLSVWLWSLLPACAFAVDLWLWHRSILLVGPGLSTLLANTQVFFMAIVGIWAYGERVGPRFIGGIVLAFLGLWLLLGGAWASLPDEYRWGVWLGLATGVCYAIYNVSLKRTQLLALSDVQPGSHEAGEQRAASQQPDPQQPDPQRAIARDAPVAQVLAIVSLGCGLVLGLLGSVEGVSFAIPDLRALSFLLVLAGVGHCLSWVLISKAMAQLSVAMIGLLLLIQPIVAFLLDVALLDRITTPREWLGLAVSLAGIFLASLKGRTRIPEQPV